MLEVRPFRGFRYVMEKVGSLDRVITPPWDVITPEARRTLAAQSPYNLARVKLPEPGPDGLPQFEAAGREFESWLAAGVLRQDEGESFYLLEQEFADMEGYVHIRRGFFAAVRLPEPGERIILGHERIFSGPVENRIRLLEETRANLGAIFVLYSDPKNALTGFLSQMDERPPDAAARTYDGVIQRLWRVPGDGAVTDFFRDKKLYVADGHHRFHTACVYRDRMREREHPTGPEPCTAPSDDDPRNAPYDNVLMGLVAFRDPGLMIYAPHRLLTFPDRFQVAGFLAELVRWFDVRAVEENLPERVREQPGCAIGVAIHGIGDYLLTLRDFDRTAFLGNDHSPAWRNLDVAVLHRGIIERILGVPPDTPLEYEHDAEKALGLVRKGRYGLAFLLKPLQSEDVRACAEAGEPMPQKATYFFPKLPSGAVIHRLV